jgi:hypothetical protein
MNYLKSKYFLLLGDSFAQASIFFLFSKYTGHINNSIFLIFATLYIAIALFLKSIQTSKLIKYGKLLTVFLLFLLVSMGRTEGLISLEVLSITIFILSLFGQLFLLYLQDINQGDTKFSLIKYATVLIFFFILAIIDNSILLMIYLFIGLVLDATKQKHSFNTKIKFNSEQVNLIVKKDFFTFVSNFLALFILLFSIASITKIDNPIETYRIIPLYLIAYTGFSYLISKNTSKYYVLPLTGLVTAIVFVALMILNIKPSYLYSLVIAHSMFTMSYLWRSYKNDLELRHKIIYEFVHFNIFNSLIILVTAICIYYLKTPPMVIISILLTFSFFANLLTNIEIKNRHTEYYNETNDFQILNSMKYLASIIKDDELSETIEILESSSDTYEQAYIINGLTENSQIDIHILDKFKESIASKKAPVKVAYIKFFRQKLSDEEFMTFAKSYIDNSNFLEVMVKEVLYTYINEIDQEKLYKILLPQLRECEEKQDPRDLANIIEAFKYIHNEKAVKYLAKYLKSPTGRVKANAAMVLYRYSDMRNEVMRTLDEMIKSKDKLEKISAIYAIGKLKIRTFKNYLKKQTESDDHLTKRISIFALTSMETKVGITKFVNLLLSNNFEIEKTIHFYSQLNPQVRDIILNKVLNAKSIKRTKLRELKRLLRYSMLDMLKEANILHSYLNQNEM